jgi:hypothetical protein
LTSADSLKADAFDFDGAEDEAATQLASGENMGASEPTTADIIKSLKKE